MDNIIIFDENGESYLIRDYHKFLAMVDNEHLHDILLTTLYYYKFHKHAEELIKIGVLERIGEPMDLKVIGNGLKTLKEEYKNREGFTALEMLENKTDNLIMQTNERNFDVDLSDEYKEDINKNEENINYNYFKYAKGKERGVVRVEKDTAHEQESVNYFLDNGYTIQPIDKKEYENEMFNN